jgi:hypothetical protein
VTEFFCFCFVAHSMYCNLRVTKYAIRYFE